MEAINYAVGWAMVKGGVNSVVYLSDRARREFPSAWVMMWVGENAGLHLMELAVAQ